SDRKAMDSRALIFRPWADGVMQIQLLSNRWIEIAKKLSRTPTDQLSVARIQSWIFDGGSLDRADC
ncbi:hypothetical protein, partial [Xanthomonas phaseoli]